MEMGIRMGRREVEDEKRGEVLLCCSDMNEV